MANKKNSTKKNNTKKVVNNNKVVNKNNSKNSIKESKSTKKESVITRVKKSLKNKKDKKIYVKKFKIDILDVFIIIVFTALLSSVVTGLIFNYQYKKNRTINETLLYSESFTKFAKVYSEVKNNYYEEVDEEGMIEAALNGMLKYLGDEYSIYLGDSDSEELISSLEGTYDGIGIVCSYDLIIKVYENSPADKAGIKAGDYIIEINDKALDNKMIVSDLINKEGNNKIVVKRNNKLITFNVSVDKVVLSSIYSDVIEKDKNKIGYIKVSSFSSNTFSQFEDALIKLESEEGITSLIIDLRGNTGGYLSTASKMINLFLDKDDIIYSLESKTGTEVFKDDTKENRNYKIVVLVNGTTASASEVFAAALKDSYGATLVGEKTYGKGKVQTLLSYGDSIVKYTSSKWLRPNGECIDEIGIIPDKEVHNTIKGNTIYDNQFEEAINILVKGNK